VNDTAQLAAPRTLVKAPPRSRSGYPEHRSDRKVVSSTSPLVTTDVPPVKKTANPDTEAGREDRGRSRRAAIVDERRPRVYDADGKLLYHDHLYSSYRAKKGAEARADRHREGDAPEEAAGTTTTTGTNDDRGSL